MNYVIGKDYIEIFGKEDFDIKEILECGQVFSYKFMGDCYLAYSADKKAKVTETSLGYIIKTNHPNYFENYFDLKTDYGKIKETLSKFPILKKTDWFRKRDKNFKAKFVWNTHFVYCISE